MNPIKLITAVFSLLSLLFVSQLFAPDVHRPDIDSRYRGTQPDVWTMDCNAALSHAESNGLSTDVTSTGA